MTSCIRKSIPIPLAPHVVLLVLLHLGVTLAMPTFPVSNTTSYQPILSKSQQRRICAELCMSGLGGPPCGDECLDYTPQDLPVSSGALKGDQSGKDGGSAKDEDSHVVKAGGHSSGDGGGQVLHEDGGDKVQKEQHGSLRRDACPLLCENDLGYPLCACDSTLSNNKTSRVNFVEICSYFCISHDYHLYGCQDCFIYKRQIMPNGEAMSNKLNVMSNQNIQLTQYVDADAWCNNKCKENDGGGACNCDLNPMSILI